MDQQTEEGAKQAFRYFFATLVYGHETGDSKPLTALSGEKCVYCQDRASDIEAIRINDSMWSDTTVVDKALEVEKFSSESVTIRYAFTISEHEEGGPDNRNRVNAANYGAAGELVWQNDAWVMSDAAATEA